ncbi:MAG: hypothetical protein JWP97_1247 [Labilithrix sp.]|nr:hypothetical protein [Labilithrix sp.]
MKTWTTPNAVEIKMDAEISSYQDDSYDPAKDGPLFVQGAPSNVVTPAETDGTTTLPRA